MERCKFVRQLLEFVRQFQLQFFLRLLSWTSGDFFAVIRGGKVAVSKRRYSHTQGKRTVDLLINFFFFFFLLTPFLEAP